MLDILYKIFFFCCTIYRQWLPLLELGVGIGRLKSSVYFLFCCLVSFDVLNNKNVFVMKISKLNFPPREKEHQFLWHLSQFWDKELKEAKRSFQRPAPSVSRCYLRQKRCKYLEIKVFSYGGKDYLLCDSFWIIESITQIFYTALREIQKKP